MTSTNEVQALREDAVLVDGDSHDVLCATGNDRASFLHRITSGKVAGLEAGRGGQTLLLDVRGHVLASLLAFVRERSVRLIVAGGQGPDISAALSKFAVMDDFQIAPEAELSSLAVLGPKAAAALNAVGVLAPDGFLDTPLLTHQDVSGGRFGPIWLAHGRRCGVDGICVVASHGVRDALVAALLAAGTGRLSPEVVEALRIAALEPALGKEITPSRFPVEVGLGGAIEHTKGCYVGQETIVRMRDRGTIRKRLALLRLAGPGLPAAGDVIATEGQPTAGQVTSAGCLPSEAPVVLAVLASAVPVGATVQIQHAGVPLAAQVTADRPPWG